MPQAVSVLGAGIVGISCALELQKRGYQVTLIDRRGVGEETSSGNAGILSYGNITPLAAPELLRRWLRLILNREADFLLHYPHLLPLIPWLLRFIVRCRRSTFLSDGQAMAALTLPSIELHKQWIAEAKAQHLINQGGGLKLYRTQRTFDRDQLERELLDRSGVKFTLLEADQVYQHEPDLKRIFLRGVLIDHSISIRDPEKLCRAYAKLFINAGGEIKQAEIKSLQATEQGWKLYGEQGSEVIEKLVLCLGAWTMPLIAPLGYVNPLAIERGYHTIFTPPENSNLSRPVFDVDASYVMSPMEMGLRVSTGTNLVYRETTPDPRQLARVLPRVREAFPVNQILLRNPWMGRRSTVPDTLPLIGPAPRHQNLWLAFAHSHMGLTMAPISAQLIANFISGDPQPFSPSACDPARYL